MAKKTNVPLKRRRRSGLNVKLIAIIAAVLFVLTIGIVLAVIGGHKKEKNPSVADNQNNETTAEPTTEEETTTIVNISRCYDFFSYSIYWRICYLSK